MKANLGAVIVRSGMSGDWRAAAFWLSRLGGAEWRERRTLIGDPEAPLHVNATSRR